MTTQRFEDSDYDLDELLKMGGLFTSVTSLLIGLPLVLFLDVGCSVVGGMLLLGVITLLFLGVAAYVSGAIIQRRKK
jgi:hypothetical protein